MGAFGLHRLGLWFPPIVFTTIHCLLSVCMDRSDHPGAAGTFSLYMAASGQPKDDHAAQAIHAMMGVLSPEAASHLVSYVSGLAMVVGAMLTGFALGRRRGAWGAGLITAVWSMTHFFALLTGNDPLSVGLGWLAVGLVFWGFYLGIRGWIPAMIGVVLISLAVGTKELALPLVGAVFMAPLVVRRVHMGWIIGCALIGYSAFWGHAWLWPSRPPRIDAAWALGVTDLQHGWKRLWGFYAQGMPEAKLDQFMVFGLALGALHFRRHWRWAIIAVVGALLLLVTAHFLGGKARPRFVAPVALLSLVVVGVGVVHWRPLGRVVFPLLLGAMTLDTWAFFDVWSARRATIVATAEGEIPTAPSPWRRQYDHTTDIGERDLSLYGAGELRTLADGSNGVAIPRLRDERHRSLMAYAILAGQPAVVMDPGKCCAGTPVNGHCARRILTALHAAQITVILPIDLPGVERIHQNEQRWLAHLTEQAALMGTMKSMRYWDVLEGGTTRVTGRPELPCEVAVAPGLRR